MLTNLQRAPLELCITTVVWHCSNPFSQKQRSFHWKLCSHWLEVFRQRHIAVVMGTFIALLCFVVVWYRRISHILLMIPSLTLGKHMVTQRQYRNWKDENALYGDWIHTTKKTKKGSQPIPVSVCVRLQQLHTEGHSFYLPWAFTIMMQIITPITLHIASNIYFIH